MSTMSQSISLKNRIIGSFLLIGLLPLCIGYAIVVGYEHRAARIRRLDDARLQARAVGLSCLGSLESRSLRGAETALNGLRAVPWVRDAALFNSRGEAVARLVQGEGEDPQPVWPDADIGFEFLPDGVLVTEVLVKDGQSLGTVSLSASFSGLRPGIVPFSITMLLGLAVLVLIVYAFAQALQTRITRPVYGLLTATKNLAVSGDTDPNRKKQRGEFGILRERVDYLLEQADIRAMNLDETEKAKKTIQQLEADLEKYRRHFEMSPLGLMVLKPLKDGTDLTFVEVNTAAEKMTRKHRTDLIGKRISTVFPAVVESGLFEILRQAGSSDNELYFPYSRHFGAEDEPWWEHIVWRLPDGEIATSFRDVSGRKQDEEEAAADREKEKQEFERRAAEEKAAVRSFGREELLNREMEGLFAAVSDDFSLPLQNIDEHSMALLKKYAASLDDEGKNNLIQLRAAEHRMLQLFNEFKRLVEISRDELKMETVDLSALAMEKSIALKEGNPGRKLEFKIQENLIVRGDARMLGMVIDQLFTNAWIYAGKKSKTTIELGVEENDDGLEFHVRDNGIGFDPADADRIFRPFQKLNPDEIYPGPGMGLALVRRIILRHGGTIRADSKPGKGSVFYFTIGESSPSPAPAADE